MKSNSKQPPAASVKNGRERNGKPFKHEEVKICGFNACLAIAKYRINDIIRVYVTEERLKSISHILHWCAENRKAYHIVTSAELEKITETHHHEGVCILAKQKPISSISELLAREKDLSTPRAIILLEDIVNPHNLGAIIRVSAHFSSAAVLVYNEDSSLNSLSSAVYRTSEGGLELQDICFIDSPIRAIKAFKKIGFSIAATSSHASESLYAAPFSQKTLFLFGAESSGLSPLCLKEADRRVLIPGTGEIESLNVACATSVVLGEFWRLHHCS